MAQHLRSAQAALLAAVTAGADFAGIAATGVGKGTTWLLPAAAAVHDALQGDEPMRLRPVHLVLVPLASQGAPHENEGDEFLRSVCKSAMPHDHRMPRALFVSRGGTVDVVRSATRAASIMRSLLLGFVHKG